MPWKIAHAHWLEIETDRVQAIIEMPRYWHHAWTPESLKAEIEGTQKLEYSLPEIQKISDELHRRGVVEDLDEP